MKRYLLWTVMALLVCSVSASADTLSFSTFVSSSSISAVEGQNNTIDFNFAGNKFVGSVYFGANNAQLYSTNLSGGAVQTFGTPIPGAGGEIVLGASLGQAGFPTGDIYAGSQNNGQIWHFANSGGVPTLFTTLPPGSGGVRQVFFDPGSSFGGNMLVTTNVGDIFKVTSTGAVSLVANVGEDVEGIDIATSAWGPYVGWLLVTSEVSGTVRLISPDGLTIITVGHVPSAETVSFVPLALNASDPLQGFYVANYPNDIQFAAASNFTSQGLLGDAVVTCECSNLAYDVHYNGVGFTFTQFAFTGNSIQQFEDGIFVTPQRIAETTTPEPSSLLLLASGLLGLGGAVRRKLLS
jgi:PEP-CTERM motif